MKKLLPLLFFMIGGIYAAFAQDTIKFKPSGKPEALVFTNFNSAFIGDKNINRFEITRAYFGYGYNFSPFWSGRVVLDVANPGVGKFQLTALLKFGYFQFQKNNLTVKFGMIGTTEYDVQEKFWGNRYILKSFQDQYNMGPSADIGVSAAYKLGKMVTADLIIQNGEGYKTLDVDSVLKTGVGVTFTPVKSLLLRAYYDRMKKGAAIQQTTAFMAGYTNTLFKVGAEYNFQNDNNLVRGHDFSGYSLYGTVFLNGATNVFARYDYLTSENGQNQLQSWNYSKDGQLYMAGLEFSPVKGLKLAPNFQLWRPRDNSRSNTASVFMNAEIRF
jgi:hypothetical protein